MADGWNGAGVDPAAYRLPGEAGNTTQYSHRHNKKERRPKNTNLSHHFCVRQRVQAGSPTSASWVSSSTGGARMARAHLNILRLFHFPDTMPITTTQYNYCQQRLELTAALVVSTTSESPPCSWCCCLASCWRSVPARRPHFRRRHHRVSGLDGRNARRLEPKWHI